MWNEVGRRIVQRRHNTGDEHYTVVRYEKDIDSWGAVLSGQS
jgi:hypothetical protein